jgi:hypothetical protein
MRSEAGAAWIQASRYDMDMWLAKGMPGEIYCEEKHTRF